MASTETLKVTTPSDCEIAMSRVFDAPRTAIFQAYTQPALLKRWLGALEGWSMPVCEIDLKVGGAYRFVWHGPGGMVMGLKGVYREITAPDRLVVTEQFDIPWYPGGAVVSTVLTEQDGRTTMTTTVRYDSKVARDGVLATPMTEGVTHSYNKLAELLAAA